MNISDGIKYHASRFEFSMITLKNKSNTSNIFKPGRNEFKSSMNISKNKLCYSRQVKSGSNIL